MCRCNTYSYGNIGRLSCSLCAHTYWLKTSPPTHALYTLCASPHHGLVSLLFMPSLFGIFNLLVLILYFIIVLILYASFFSGAVCNRALRGILLFRVSMHPSFLDQDNTWHPSLQGHYNRVAPGIPFPGQHNTRSY